jgi:hypothetical protein
MVSTEPLHARERWDGSLPETALRHLPPALRAQIRQARRDERQLECQEGRRLQNGYTPFAFEDDDTADS